MSLDAVVVVVLVLFAVAGALSGALRQLVKLVAVVLGWLAAVHLAPRLVPTFFGASPLQWQRAATAVGTFVAVAVVVSLLGRAVTQSVHGPDGRTGPLDRAGGALVGGAKAGLAIWVILSALALAGGPVGIGPWRFDPRASDFGAFAARHNLLVAADAELAAKVEKALRLTTDPKARDALAARDPGLRKLLEDPRVRALLERARASGDHARVLAEDPAVGDLLERLDPPK